MVLSALTKRQVSQKRVLDLLNLTMPLQGMPVHRRVGGQVFGPVFPIAAILELVEDATKISRFVQLEGLVCFFVGKIC
ncbi:hypothetical protein AVDCRST_MAG81-670 [uncultured Synechococcales cyanobacterium]|uniref:Uncharacterized protein n=1 Tax=uncultured Synechococcales cyanobacterium TaxID=1936017 RepID=A0A6J4UUZ5_9CYAN|nr:hypothetical protein AVDCRST_MAG81-670 [uncultured Synechococcales cyanobacterium]